MILLAGLLTLVAVESPSLEAVPVQSWDMVAEADTTQALPEEVVRRRIEMLLRNGRREDAVQLLEDRKQRWGLEPMLLRRLARLYDQLGRHQDLEALVEEKLDGDYENAELADLRMLAEARLSVGKEAEAQEMIEAILARDPEDPGLMRLVATMLSHADRTQEAIKILIEGRKRMNAPYEFAQHLGSLYADQGQWKEAVTEYLNVIVMSPLNVSLIRGQILDMSDDPVVQEMILEVADRHYSKHRNVPQLGLVLAELRQRAGDHEAAWEILAPMVGSEALLQDLLQMAMAGLADSRLPQADPKETLSSLTLSARVLRGLLRAETVPSSLQPRVFDSLNRTLLAIMEKEHFTLLAGEDRLAVLTEARQTILEMGERFPNDKLTSLALLRLAGIYVNSLHRADEAIELYRKLQLDPSAPREQTQAARVGLGQAYIATGDTASARDLFTDMGRDSSFEAGQGRAHYHLGLLDFMGGHFETAQKRLSSVAAVSPTATFTNDSLDLALVLTEQLLAQAPDAVGLAGYGKALYYQSTFQADSLRVQLKDLSTSAAAGLQQRARLDLARHYQENDEIGAALAELQQLADMSAYTRYAAAALDLKGDILKETGDLAGARAAYTSIVLEHDSYVFLDSVRDKLRLLPETDGKEDLP